MLYQENHVMVRRPSCHLILYFYHPPLSNMISVYSYISHLLGIRCINNPEVRKLWGGRHKKEKGIYFKGEKRGNWSVYLLVHGWVRVMSIRTRPPLHFKGHPNPSTTQLSHSLLFFPSLNLYWVALNRHKQRSPDHNYPTLSSSFHPLTFNGSRLIDINNVVPIKSSKL